MKLVMFDIDGTLTQSNAIDDTAYLRALSEVFGFSQIDTNWAAYTHVTDACILNEICQHQLRRPPFQQEVQAFQQCFLQSLAAANSRIKPLLGASELLRQFRYHLTMKLPMPVGLGLHLPCSS